MRDLKQPKWMYAKAAMFLVIGLLTAAMVLAEHPSWQTVALLALMIWAFCRAYYFAFYVIERYIDGNFRYSGLGSLIVHLAKARSNRRCAPEPRPEQSHPPLASNDTSPEDSTSSGKMSGH